MNKNQLVSVCMITYGHEDYISQAINGVLMQECDFEIELIIANDCSPDKTDSIITEILENHPKSSCIKYKRQEKNIGMMPNFLYAIAQCSGKYVAMCEGDDYWITKDKLQQQVSILEINGAIGLVYTSVNHFYQNTGKSIAIPARFVNNSSDAVPMMLKNKYIEFATTLFRRSVLTQAISTVKDELTTGVIGDTRILLDVAQNSQIYFLDEVTAMYRIVEGSASHPVQIDKYIFALYDSYLCRKTFVKRYGLNKHWLSHSVCNTNRALINKAFVSSQYAIALKLIRSIIWKDMLHYSTRSVFIKKMDFRIWIKLFASLIGLGVLRQKNKRLD